MALVKPQSTRFAQIKVLGIGGGGGNCLNNMVGDSQIEGIDFIAVNTDAQALLVNKAPKKLQIGEKLTKGLGAGGNPEIGQKAAEESKEEIKRLLEGTDMVFLTGGEGGGTCTGATPVLAQIAREMGILTVAVVTKPFNFEGRRRMETAVKGIEELRDKVDTLIVIPNQKLLDNIDEKVSLIDAFKMVDSILISGVTGIADLITKPGLINLDFADVRAVMRNAGSALMGIGQASGENRALEAAKLAIASPLLETSIEGAKGIIFNVSGGKNMTMREIEQAAEMINSQADPDANIIFGASLNENLNNEIKITLIAAGFDEKRSRLAQMAKFQIPTGIVSEIPEEKQEDQGEKPLPFINQEQEEEKTPIEDLGEEYEVPAFLRQGKKKLLN
ncbi:cell division protein FtsZ [Candidatus Shapirobacteria bacterium]|nr:cell division protein FtsZ [Candidatus Shapirobacteria bacterium]